MNKDTKGFFREYKWYLMIIVLLLILIAGAAGILAMQGRQKKDESLAVAGEKEGSEESEALFEETESKEQEESAFHEETSEEEPEAEPQLLVAVPAESLSLRQTPGLGEDKIGELYAGECLEWFGEAKMDGELEFYKVRVQNSGKEGYVPAAYCTPVQFEYDEADLSIVDVSKQIYSYEEMEEDIGILQRQYPDRIRTEVIGRSVLGRNIYEIVLGNADASEHIMMQAGIHGREYICSQLVMRMLEYYAYYYDSGSYGGISYRELFDKTAIHIVPMSNPDGIAISQFGEGAVPDESWKEFLRNCYFRDMYFMVYKQNSNEDWYWYDAYKEDGFDRIAQGIDRDITYEEYLEQWKANANGVDLNKNFAAMWEEVEGKNMQAYADFKGYGCESEPEVRTLIDLANRWPYACFISYHAMGQLLYYDIAGNTEENSLSAGILAQMLSDINRYKLAPTTDVKYNVSAGGFNDWIQLEKGTPGVTVEVGKTPCPVPISEFPSIFLRNRETWAMLCREMYRKTE